MVVTDALQTQEEILRSCKLLVGDNIKPNNLKEAKELIGLYVEYLRDVDIDKSGRGYIFPRSGVVESAIGREIVINGSYILIRNIKEMTRMSK